MRKEKRGFTLIEMLVVIAIIATLSVVVLTTLTSSTDQARQVSILPEFRSIQILASDYLVANETFGTPAVASSLNCSSGVFSDPNIDTIQTQLLSKTEALGQLCAIGVDGASYSYSVNSPTHGVICLSNQGLVRNSSAIGGGPAIATCQ